MSGRSATPNQAKTLRDLAQHFYALKDVLRLEMIALLADRRECTVNEMAAALKKSQPLVSWHLRRLKTAGVVRIRRAGREVYCSLDRDALVRSQQAFLDLLGPS
ncbi:MAG TPA: metalloregulator ArsR/SmtB family transcription factor [Anaerolineae bacterium]|nr:metalloregulator ArsR/SmtB family transcription factor [Anaerolineae bacterium]